MTRMVDYTVQSCLFSGDVFHFCSALSFHKGLKDMFAALLLADRNWIKTLFFPM